MSIAYMMALDAAEREREVQAEKERQEQAERDREEQERQERVDRTFLVGSDVLKQWFPGSTWRVHAERRNGYDNSGSFVVLVEANEDLDPKLKVAVNRDLRDDSVEILCVSQHYDTSISDHYWAGPRVKSAADVGRWILRS